MRNRAIGLAIMCVAAYGCSPTRGKLSPPASTSRNSSPSSQFPGATIDPTRVPNPSEMKQHIGLGETWQMTVESARSSGKTLAVTVELLNGTSKAIRLPATLGSMFTARDGLFGTDVAATATHAVPNLVPARSTTTISITFAPFTPSSKTPTLLLRGSNLNGSLDASVSLQLST